METGLFDRDNCGAGADVVVLSDDVLDAELVEIELSERQLASRRAELIGEKARRGSYRDDGHATLVAWLRATGNWATGRATRAKRLARLCRQVPEVAAALRSGRIGLDQADELARVFSNPRCGHLLPASMEILLDHAHRLSFHEFRLCARRWETLADADGAHRDGAEAEAARTASVLPVDGSGVVVSASGGRPLVADELVAIFEWFCEREFLADTTAAEQTGGDLPRTDGQRRFDALVEIFLRARGNPNGGLPIPVLTNVYVDQHTFEAALAAHGLCDQPTDLEAPDAADACCETGRGLLLTHDDLVRCALSGHVRRMVIDSAGTVTNAGHRQRLFAGTMREAALARSSSCEFPGCTVPSSLCQIDHMAEHGRDNGATNTANSAVLCAKHNRFKHRHYRLRRDRYGRPHFQRVDGRWLAPAGRPPPDAADLLPLEFAAPIAEIHE